MEYYFFGKDCISCTIISLWLVVLVIRPALISTKNLDRINVTVSSSFLITQVLVNGGHSKGFQLSGGFIQMTVGLACSNASLSTKMYCVQWLVTTTLAIVDEDFCCPREDGTTFRMDVIVHSLLA